MKPIKDPSTKGLVPPFCPNKYCIHHLKPQFIGWWRRAGYHCTDTFGKVPRFKCRTCRKGFSTQTFRINYWAKKLIDYPEFHQLSSESMGVRALARHFNCSTGAVQNRTDRLGRQMIALHTHLHQFFHSHEDICIDGFQSFDVSQYFPNNITISITRGTRFIHEATHATLRRSGSMTDKQKEKRDALAPLFTFEKKSIERSFTDILDHIVLQRPPVAGHPLVIITNEKLEYVHALQGHSLFGDQDADHLTFHQRISSRAERTYSNPLFASNYIDRELRKDQAAHRRETTCHCCSVSKGMMRLWCYIGWHNYHKRFRINNPAEDLSTHAEHAGIPKLTLEWFRDVAYRGRAFLSRFDLTPCDTEAWLKQMPTPLKTGPEYLPKFAWN
jgi:hypothetical protein